MATRLIGTDTTDPRLPQVVIDATIAAGDFAAGDHTHTGSGGGTGTDPNAVESSAAGDGPRPETMAVFSGNGFAELTTKDPNTFYVITPSGGNQGSLYLGNTLLLGTQLTIPSDVPSVAVTPGDTQATVTWGTPSAGGLTITGFTVQRSLNDTTGFATVATPSSTARAYTDTGLTNGTLYYYRVTATNALGISPFASVVSARPVTGSVITLVSDDLTADFGSPVTFTATITSGGLVILPVGNVTFKRGGNVMAGVAVATGGTATFATASLAVGSYSVTAEYDGGSTYLPSVSNTLSQVIQFPGGPTPTSATLTSDDASSTPSQAVTFSCAAVRTATGAPVNSGTVVFRDGGVTLSTPRAVDPATGIATFTTSVLTTATHTITADFAGAPFYAPSTSNAVTQIVAVGTGGAPISQAIYVSKPIAVTPEFVSLRSTVRSGSAAVTIGTIEFFDGSTSLGMGTALNIFGESTFVLPTGLSVGTHTITAQYTDSTAAHEDDTSSPYTHTVVSSITAPSPNTWAAAFASDDLATITAWYDYNTGHLTNGFTNADLWNPHAGTSDFVDITASWLTANAAAGKVVDDGGGHWTITGLKTEASAPKFRISLSIIVGCIASTTPPRRLPRVQRLGRGRPHGWHPR